MNSNEINRFIAENVMGYKVYTPQEWETELDANDCVPDLVLLITDLGLLQDVFYPSSGGGGYYNPYDNLTQAEEAVRIYCEQKKIRWTCERINRKYLVTLKVYSYMLNQFIIEEKQIGDTLSAAICYTLVAEAKKRCV